MNMNMKNVRASASRRVGGLTVTIEVRDPTSPHQIAPLHFQPEVP